MRAPARLALAASLAAVALTAACSDSSGPSSTNTPSEVAARFDSIYVDAFARSDSGSNGYSTRVELSTLLEIPAALGASPSSITVSTATGTEHWKGYEFVELTSPGQPVDSEFVLLAYRESAAHTVIAVFFDSTGTGAGGGVITNDTLSMTPNTAHGTTHLASVGATCSTPSASLVNPEFHMTFFSSCSLATFQTTLAMTFPTASGVDPALASLSFSTTAVNGIRVIAAANNSLRVQSMLHALHKMNRF